jgi:hypothetical protein
MIDISIIIGFSKISNIQHCIFKNIDLRSVLSILNMYVNNIKINLTISSFCVMKYSPLYIDDINNTTFF